MGMTSNWQLNLGGALMLMSLLLAASCSTYQETQPTPAVAPAPASVLAPPRQTRARSSGSVRASFQGEEEAGHITANGERFDPHALTAASKTLPLGSKVVVTNPTTGKSVTVRINDRGPYVRGRSLDLSKRAAEEIGITKKGVAPVKVKRVASEPARSKSPNPATESASTLIP